MSNIPFKSAAAFSCYFIPALVLVLVCTGMTAAQPPSQSARPNRQADKPATAKPDSTTQPAFRIDQPGTITFTVGMVIKGKIEKPQVIIFLPKEKTWFRELEFNHSFTGEIARPLPFVPILE